MGVVKHALLTAASKLWYLTKSGTSLWPLKLPGDVLEECSYGLAQGEP